MGIACKINRNSQGTPTSVTTESGKRSKLFDAALELTKDPKNALEVYATAFTEEFQDEVLKPALFKAKKSGENILDENGEPSLEMVTKYIGSKNWEGKELNFSQSRDIKEAMMSTPDLRGKVAKAFIKDGLFVIDKDMMLKSGLYSLPEVIEIVSNEELQQEIRSTVEGFMNTPDNKFGELPNFQVVGVQGARRLDFEENSFERLSNMSTAIKMQSEGKHPSVIKYATGWEMGVDGHWRYETKDFVEPELFMMSNWDAAEWITKKKSKLGRDLMLKDFVPSKLVKAYPSISKFTFEMIDVYPGFDASVNSEKFTVKWYTGSQQTLASNLVHEIQHIIQKEEGFARGGNTEMFGWVRSMDQIKLMYELFKKKRDGVRMQDAINSIRKEQSHLVEDLGYGIISNAMGIVDHTDVAVGVSLLGSMANVPFSSSRYTNYERLAGEVESRNAQERMEMDMEERRTTLLEETESIPREHQIKYIEAFKEALDNFNYSKDKVVKTVIEKLKKTGLSAETLVLKDAEIAEELRKIGLSSEGLINLLQSKGVSGKNPMFQVDSLETPFYSNAIEALNNLKDKNKKNVQGWINALTDVQKNGGQKNVSQELAWMGLEDSLNNYVQYMQPKNGNIPYEVVAEKISKNQIKISEEVMGAPEPVKLDFEKVEATEDEINSYESWVVNAYDEVVNVYEDTEVGYRIVESDDGDFYPLDVRGDILSLNSFKSLEEAAEEVGKHLADQNSYGEVQYENYTLTGGDNYREVVLTTPSNYSQAELERLESMKEDARIEGDMERVFDLEDRIDRLKSKEYVTKHFSKHKNVLAHMRLNDRVTPEGEKVLFVEEIQSDWAQAGKKIGYGKKPGQIYDVARGVYQARKKGDKALAERMRAKADKLGITQEEIAKALEEHGDFTKQRPKGVPEMPYSKTDQWAGLLTRRILQMAAQKGYDRISWVTGKQSADRYSLRSQVEYIDVVKPISNYRQFEIVMLNDKSVSLTSDDKGNITDSNPSEFIGKKLDEVVGKEMAEKLLSATEEGTIKDENLEVGGEGMLAFYDSIIPKVMKKEAKRFDKSSRIDVIDFKAPKDARKNADLIIEYNSAVSEYLRATSKHENRIDPTEVAEATEKVERLRENLPQFLKEMIENRPIRAQIDYDYRKDLWAPGKQLSIKLSDKAKENLMGAIPLFQLGKAGISATPKGFTYKGKVYLNSDKMGLDTPIHEFGHLWSDWAKNSSKEVYNRGIELMKTEGQDYVEFVKRHQPHLTGEALYEEALAQAIGEKGAKIVDETKKDSFLEWMKALWTSLISKLGITSYTVEEIADMDMAEFTEAVAVDLMKGTKVKRDFFKADKDTTKKNALGMYKSNNPHILANEVKQLLGGVNDRQEFEQLLKDSDFETLKDDFFNNEDFANEFFRQMSNMSRVREFKISESGLQRRLTVETQEFLEETITPNDNGINERIAFLETIPSDIWYWNSEEITEILKDIRVKAIGLGINLKNLEDMYSQRSQDELINLLTSIKNVNLQPNEVRLKELAKSYEQFFGVDKKASIKVVNLDPNFRDKTLAYVDTNNSAYEMFEKYNLLEVKDNVYQKINKGENAEAVIDDLTMAVINGNAFIFTNTKATEENFDELRKEISGVVDKVSKEINARNFKADELRMMAAYKLYFSTPFPLDVDNRLESREAKKWSNFKGDFNYLVTEFIADFNKESIIEEQKGSKVYEDFYANFEINNKGIVLKNTDPITMEKIRDYLKSDVLSIVVKENLPQYSIVSKDSNLDVITEWESEVKTEDFYRDFYTNYPNQAPRVTDYTNVDTGVIAAKGAPRFINTNKGMFEAVAGIGEVAFYAKLPDAVPNYALMGVEQPSIDLDVRDYDHLQSIPDSIVKVNNKLSSAEKTKINNEQFNCE